MLSRWVYSAPYFGDVKNFIYLAENSQTIGFDGKDMNKFVRFLDTTSAFCCMAAVTFSLNKTIEDT